MQLGLNKLPWYGAMLFALAIGGAGMISYHYFYAGFPQAFADIVPIGESAGTLRASMAEKETQLARERQDIQKGLDAERRLVEFREELKNLERQFNDLKVVLPDKRDVADMLRRIQTLATQSSLTIRGFKPQAVATRQQHAEWPISLSLEGTYHDLGAFFDKVSRMPRIINISGIQIKTHGANEPSPATVDAQCTVTTFVLMETPPAPVTAAGARRPAAAGARPPAAAR
jgi:type IV pilus assembly protein PilO